jgi:actin-like ATPase involved in cell morphogenesis
MLLGDREVPVVEAVAAVLSSAAAEARRQRGGTPPIQVCLTYPARWATARQSVLRDAATRAGLGDVVLISEPEAAAAYFAKHDNVPFGCSIAVYDLGGGTFDVAVLTATPSGFRLIGRPGGIDPLGGDDIDERLLSMTTDRAGLQLAGKRSAAPPAVEFEAHGAALRQEIRRAKEDLASSDTAEFVLPGLGVTAQLSRADLRTAAGEDIDASVSELLRIITLAGVPLAQLAGIYLAGGSSRLPLVRESLSRMLAPGVQRSVRTLNDPKAAVALGGAELIYQQEVRSSVGPPSGLQLAARPRQPLKRYQIVAGAMAVVLLLVVGGIWFHYRDSNVVSGTLRDALGNVMPNVPIVVSTGDGLAGGDQIKTKTDAKGRYTGKLPRGSYAINASATLQFGGMAVEVLLVPHELGAEMVELPASGGATLDLDLKTSGQKPETNGGAWTDYFGGTLSINQWFTIDGDDPIAPLAAVRPDLEVTFHFEPIGPLLDGNPSAAFDVTRSIGDLISRSGILDHDEILYDIPLASYVITATLNGPSGPIPLVLRYEPLSPPQDEVTIPMVALCGQCITMTLSPHLEVGIDASYLN